MLVENARWRCALMTSAFADTEFRRSRVSRDLSRAAIVAVHFVNDIVHPDGALAGFGYPAGAAERGVVAKAAQLLAAARQQSLPVFYTRVGWDAGHATLVPNSPLIQTVGQLGCLVNGTWQTEIIEELTPAAGDIVVTNERVSGFINSPLDTLLRARGVGTILIFGVSTNLSVESTVRHASDLGYDVILVEDASSTTSEEAHSVAVETMRLLVADVVTTEQVLSDLHV